MPIYKKVNKGFFKKWTPDMAYILGFFAADGYMTLNKRGAYFWNIQITDKKLLEEIRKTIKSGHKISMRKGKENEKDLYRLQIGSKEMCYDLSKLGMKTNKTKSLTVPNIPDKYFDDFARGYFDGDGHVWVGNINKGRKTPHFIIQTVFTSCSCRFLETLKIRLESFKITKGVLRKGKGDYFRLVYSINGSLKLYDFMYNHIVRGQKSIFLQRKKKVFDRFIQYKLDNAAVV